MSKDLFDKFLYEEKDKLDISNSAVSLFENMILEENFEEFLTLPAYEHII